MGASPPPAAPMRTLLLVSLLIACPAALAAPFCAVYSWGSQCVFSDLDACLVSLQEDGECIINEAEVRRPLGDARYCVVTPLALPQCQYEEEDACRVAARNQAGTCMMRID